MFTRNRMTEKSDLQKAIDKVHAEMTATMSDEKEYAQMVDQLTKLYALQNTPSSRRVSPDTLAIVGGNVLVAAMVVGYERANVVTTKALTFLHKLR